MKPRFLLVISALLFIASVGFFLTGRPKLAADSPVLLREIQKLNELVSVKYSIQKVIGIEEQKRPVGMEKILLITQAQVLAGIDLSQLKSSNIIMGKDKSRLIQLPPAQILHIVLNEKETKVWDHQITWWTPWVPYNPELESRARQAAIEATRKAALDMGILKEAEKNARTSIRALLEAAGITQISFNPPS
ncbi:DUF4230 domain-containing protein [Bryobacter aggregatus]|uniref:DUF4230 domain-containing protein n=1 Tax=Bryobacter aggregatus TaxID=360054 RepID=UPI0004E2597E|nr:DUF4230 domain-containing protein [Bryobacter aggregatus]